MFLVFAIFYLKKLRKRLKSSIFAKTIKTQIRKNPNYIFTGDYNIDEPAGTTSLPD